jgi:xanthine dehydrogenase accessory factor
VAARIPLTENTAAVVMTHNYPDDVELLRALLPSNACYLGVLGPRERTSKLLEAIGVDAFGMMEGVFARLHSPAGVDIGAETPEEIALSIVAEIRAVCAARGGGFLRDRNAPIHDERASERALAAVVTATRVHVSEAAPLVVSHSS